MFYFNGTTWVQQSKLTASDGAAGNIFGTSVFVSDKYAIVGSPGKTGNKGGAYIFELSGTTWSQKSALTASDGAADDYFGISVSASGTTAIVGADRKNYSSVVDAGGAYIYVFNGTTWNEQKLVSPSPATNDFFGGSVAASGDYILIGAEGKSSSKGEAYTDTAGTITNYTPTISPIPDQYTN
ncbi:MAG: hypothetical protein HC887_13255, partial [Desulfobacteraceae bacterium]|nr:hypothetical protein [Desulfobacteraceae bacterium]